MNEDVQHEARYEGFYLCLFCTNCETTFDVDRDVEDGEDVVCDNCGEELVVTGR